MTTKTQSSGAGTGLKNGLFSASEARFDRWCELAHAAEALALAGRHPQDRRVGKKDSIRALTAHSIIFWSLVHVENMFLTQLYYVKAGDSSICLANRTVA